MHLAREGGREREIESSAWSAMAGVCERDTFVNRVEKGGCVVERVRD